MSILEVVLIIYVEWIVQSSFKRTYGKCSNIFRVPLYAVYGILNFLNMREEQCQEKVI